MYTFSLFGGLMFFSLFNLNFIKENFFILKSTKGKGVFCLFISSTFLIANSTQNIIMTLVFAACGGGFIFVGFMKPELDTIQDVSKADVAKTAFENRALLNKV